MNCRNHKLVFVSGHIFKDKIFKLLAVIILLFCPNGEWVVLLRDAILLDNDFDIEGTITQFKGLTKTNFLKELPKKLKAVMQVSDPIFLVINWNWKLQF